MFSSTILFSSRNRKETKTRSSPCFHSRMPSLNSLLPQRLRVSLSLDLSFSSFFVFCPIKLTLCHCLCVSPDGIDAGSPSVSAARKEVGLIAELRSDKDPNCRFSWKLDKVLPHSLLEISEQIKKFKKTGAVFGVPLEEILQREGTNTNVPRVVSFLVDWLRRNGFSLSLELSFFLLVNVLEENLITSSHPTNSPQNDVDPASSRQL